MLIYLGNISDANTKNIELSSNFKEVFLFLFSITRFPITILNSSVLVFVGNFETFPTIIDAYILILMGVPLSDSYRILTSFEFRNRDGALCRLRSLSLYPRSLALCLSLSLSLSHTHTHTHTHTLSLSLISLHRSLSQALSLSLLFLFYSRFISKLFGCVRHDLFRNFNSVRVCVAKHLAVDLIILFCLNFQIFLIVVFFFSPLNFFLFV